MNIPKSSSGRIHLQHGIPAPTKTSGDITVVFSPRIAKVTDMISLILADDLPNHIHIIRSIE